MSHPDPEKQRLSEAAQATAERLRRLEDLHADPIVLEAARDLRDEAAQALARYQPAAKGAEVGAERAGSRKEDKKD